MMATTRGVKVGEGLELQPEQVHVVATRKEHDANANCKSHEIGDIKRVR